MRQFWTGCILLSTALSSSAVTLGRHSGQAIVGRPLDVRLQVIASPDEDPLSQCIAADVFYGDSQVPSGLVTVTVTRGTSGADASVRVQAAPAINEAFVSLYMRAGCDSAFSRRYTLLADPLSEPVAPAPSAPAPVAAAAAAAAGAAAPAQPAPVTAPAAAPSTRRATVAPAPRAVTRPPTKARDAGAPAVRPKAAAPAEPAKPRLKLDPVDPVAAAEPDLKLSAALGAGPSANEADRAQAARRWDELNGGAQDAARGNEALAQVQADLARVLAAQKEQQERLAVLTQQLEQARSERFNNPVVWALAGLLLLCLGALARMSRLNRRKAAAQDPKAWWDGQGAQAPAAEAPAAPRRVATGSSDLMPLTDHGDIDVQIDLDAASPPVRSRVVPTPREPVRPVSVAPVDQRDFAPSAIGTNRAVATEELFDVQQQADFFVSLGEDEQAIQVLRNHLAESHEPSPLAYLDLFRIYHRLGRQKDYEALRDEFNHLFNADAPAFDRYTAQGKGLEAYDTAFARIQALWPQPRVLDLIERSIFRDLQDEETEVFDLEAYRELLLLHAMAKDMIEKQSPNGSPKSSFQHTAMEPLKAATRNAELREGRNTMPMVDHTPPASPRLGLDVNLDELAVQAFEASLPDVPLADEPVGKAADKPDEGLIDFEVFDFDKAGTASAPISASRAVPAPGFDAEGDDREGRPTQPPARP